jgi:hypothetical protein
MHRDVEALYSKVGREVIVGKIKNKVFGGENYNKGV